MTELDDQRQREVDEVTASGRAAADEKLPATRPWWRRPQAVGIIAAAVLVVAALISSLVAAADANQSAHSARSDRSAANGALTEANRRISALGGTPVATPSAAATGAQGPRGETGDAGAAPTETQVAAAVAVYCSQHADCSGTPSAAQVRTAVAAYCATGLCRGATGTTGAPGSSGPTGAAGKDGTTPSADDVAAAVSAYCDAHGGCTGPAGPKGETGATGAAGASGANGTDGRGVASIDCTGLGLDQLVIHYDDGTTETVTCNAGTATTTPSGTETP